MNTRRISFVHFGLTLFAALIVARLVQVQIVERDTWQRTAENQQLRELTLSPQRGAILDATGSVLVESREQRRLIIEPQNLVATRRNRKTGVIDSVDYRPRVKKWLKELRVPNKFMTRIFNSPKLISVELPGLYLPADIARFKGTPGVTSRAATSRVNSASDGLRGVVGALAQTGEAVSGLELEMDFYLRGSAGRRPVVLDGLGGRIASPQFDPVEAQPGHTIMLTIYQSLQQIAEQALADARKRTGASGGDVIIISPHDGAILAVAGVRNGKAALTSTPIAEAYEPGSVIKPFVVSRLLDQGLASADELINTENGTWVLANRTIRDEHRSASMTVRDVIRFSSNIGASKLAMRLDNDQAYQTFRDFGFGSYTGVSYPAESRGRVSLPQNWTGLTLASMAMGYEMMATPLQIALAYAAIANGGELLEPSLVREVRSADGEVIFQQHKRVVREVMSSGTAALMREMLKSVVDSGTSTSAGLDSYGVAGKSGTARRLEPGSRSYAAGHYNATFAGMFPADDPQLVIVARLIDPSGVYFGGVVSGAMVNAIIQGALAAPDAGLDRGVLARVAQRSQHVDSVGVQWLAGRARGAAFTGDSASRDVSVAHDGRSGKEEVDFSTVPSPSVVVVDLPVPPAGSRSSARVAELGDVPFVRGLDVRSAVRVLHAAGYAVRVVPGRESGTRPAEGSALRRGATVQLLVPGIPAAQSRARSVGSISRR